MMNVLFKPIHLITLFLTLLSLAFYITSVSSPQWAITDQTASNQAFGPYRACAHDWVGHVHECKNVDENCSAGFSDPVGMISVTPDCSYLRGTRALSVIALILTGLSLLPLLGLMCIKHDLFLRVTSSVLQGLAAICGLIAMALFSGMSFHPRSEYGYAFPLFVTAWVLNAINSIMSLYYHTPAVMGKSEPETAAATTTGTI